MSTLELRGSRKAGHTTLSRRHHDLGGTDHDYVGSLPDESADALRHGGSIRIRLREEAGPNEAPWLLEVIREGRALPGSPRGARGSGRGARSPAPSSPMTGSPS